MNVKQEAKIFKCFLLNFYLTINRDSVNGFVPTTLSNRYNIGLVKECSCHLTNDNDLIVKLPVCGFGKISISFFKSFLLHRNKKLTQLVREGNIAIWNPSWTIVPSFLYK